MEDAQKNVDTISIIQAWRGMEELPAPGWISATLFQLLVLQLNWFERRADDR